MKNWKFSIFVIPLIFTLISCMSAGRPRDVVPGEGEGVYATTGRSLSPLQAMNQAKIEGIKMAVVDIVGFEMELANKAKLASVIYNTKNPNMFLVKDKFEVTRKDQSGEEWIYECLVVVDLDAVESTLRANGLMGETGGAEGIVAESERESPKTEETVSLVDKIEETPEVAEITDEELAIIRRYVDTMTYLVFFNEESEEEIFYQNGAVSIANEFLVSKTLETIDLGQVEKLKKDQARVYEEETGAEISLIQWIAQKLNADVYVEIDAQTSGESVSDKRHYGQANVTIKAFESLHFLLYRVLSCR